MKVLTLGLAVWAGALAGCAAKKPTPPPEPPPAAQAATPPSPVLSGTLDEQTVTKTATVQKIDQKTRHVTLRRPDGTKFTIVVDPEVHNLPQVKKGDVVRVTYRESIAYEVKKSDQAHPATGSASRRSPWAGESGRRERRQVPARSSHRKKLDVPSQCEFG